MILSVPIYEMLWQSIEPRLPLHFGNTSLNKSNALQFCIASGGEIVVSRIAVASSI